MDRAIRNAIERATQAMRHLLEVEFEAQLEGTFDILADGSISGTGGGALTTDQAGRRASIVAAIERKRAAGMPPDEAVADYLRDAAFTAVNRFVALKMLEARGLVQQCVSRGPDSAGYGEFAGLAPGLLLLPDGRGYRLYLESLFDELSTEIKGLFDRFDPAAVLWPRRGAFEALLATLNGPELAGVWGDDETIGWVYQYFNGDEERKRMRDESQAPRNSRELAVRNQFFTPRYVVQFLTDNTLGRTWVEMHGEETSLLESCEYLVRPIDGPFGSRPRKDPRDLRILDPACGSGHFLLYSFDLMLTIYEEAWTDGHAAPASALTGRTLRTDYPELAQLREAAPRLIVEHNLYGVDIDARCAQIAALALWLRAQRAYQELGVPADTRPRIERTHIVIAEPMPGSRELAEAFASELDRPFQRALFSRMIEEMRLAGELGTLLQVELSLADDIRRARRQFLAEQERPSLFPNLQPTNEQGRLDLSGVTDEAVFHDAEETILAALRRFADSAGGMDARRRLFAGDAAQGVALIDLVRTPFDVVLMNPPFGDATPAAAPVIAKSYPTGRHDLATAFMEMALERVHSNGLIGVLTTRAFIGNQKLMKWRERALYGDRGRLNLYADLGIGVLDALVEAGALVISPTVQPDASSGGKGLFLSVLNERNKPASLLRNVSDPSRGPSSIELDLFRQLPEQVMCYWLPSDLLTALVRERKSRDVGIVAAQGLASGDDFRFFRLRWEVAAAAIGRGRTWMTIGKGGEYQPYYADFDVLVNWRREGVEMKDHVTQSYPYLNGDWGWVVKNSDLYFRSGLTYPERTASDFSPRVMPSEVAFSAVGQAIFADSPESLWGYLAGSYTRLFKTIVDAFVGSGDSSVSGSAAKHIRSGLLNGLPHPLLTPSPDLMAATQAAVVMARRLVSQSEETATYAGPADLRRLAGSSLAVHVRRAVQAELSAALHLLDVNYAAEREQVARLALGPGIVAYLDSDYGEHPLDLPSRPLDELELREVARLDVLELSERGVAKHGARRQLTKKSFLADRHLELCSHLLGVNARTLAFHPAYVKARSERQLPVAAARLISHAVGIAFGRFDLRFATGERELASEPGPFDPLPVCSPAMLTGDDGLPLSCPPAGYPLSFPEDGILVDDPGHPRDLTTAVRAAFDVFSGVSADAVWQDAAVTLDPKGHDLRVWLATEFFEYHLKGHSKSRRKAPILWQLGPASARYSTWAYAHRLTRDSLFALARDVVAPKLALEERRQSGLVQEGGPNPTAKQRAEIAAQDAIVAELRVFADEVRRVAPLWNPDLDDGIVLVEAPLWRLVPHKPWAKELKSRWDDLAAGKYDWAHLAMHLWPERVVPKCATDRSLAIAHGLEDVFWAEGADDKWTKRARPTRSIEDLVAERTSPAVKAALADLLAAPAPASGGRGRGKSN